MKKSDLAKIRASLEKMKDDLIASLRETVVVENEKEPGDEADKAVGIANQYTSHIMRNRLTQTLEKVAQALERLDTEDFGICVECEEPIAVPRLLVAPTAVLCLPCQEDLEEEQRKTVEL